MVRKTLSPSAIRRNVKRKEDYLKRKSNPLETGEVDLETSGHDDDPFQCDQCDYRANCKVSLSKPIRKYHKVIPQIDGLEDVKTFEVKSVQTDDPKVMEYGMQTEYHKIKESEVQTDFTDTTTGVTVKWGEKDSLTLPPGTVGLRYEPNSYEETKVIDYPVMSSPASLVFHPVWGLGEYLANDEEHI